LDVNFDASTSTDSDGDALVSYSFEFGDGASATGQPAPTATHRYAAAGSYIASVTVTDARGATSAPATRTVEVTQVTSDTAPDDFSFVERTGVATSVFITSEGKTITGMDAATPIGVNNGQYSLDGGAFTSTAGIINPGQALRVRHVSAGTADTPTESQVTVGTSSVPFRSRTSSLDRTPDAFSFPSQSGVTQDSDVISAPVTLSGFNTGVPVVAGAGQTYSLNGADFTSANGVAHEGDSLRVKHRSSATSAGYTKTTIKVGGVAGSFTTRSR
jgi:hypothetical protein